MQPQARIVHQTRERLRLRIPEKRKDLPFFLDLYDELRRIPGVTEVVANPMTGSLLLRFPDGYGSAVTSVLAKSPRLCLGGTGAHGKQAPSPTAHSFGGIDRVFAEAGRVTDLRTVLFLLVLGLTVRQVLRGQILAPALTMLIYGVNLVSSFKQKETPQDASA
ncbi:MAG: hypothetical protein U9Q81_02825 [Pseudomonadota bacterium]|nr:hypothetical protein [Pseudomonadota bacterium]